MDTAPQTDDLQLVLAISRLGSVGAAARHLRVTQPSASQRLARLERRAGVVLFERDTRGARPTPAGAEMTRQAEHILGHLGAAFDAARAAGAAARPRLGTIASLAESVLPIVDELYAGAVDTVVDHGDRMLAWLDEGTLDGAVIGLVDQVTLPRSLRALRIGRDRHVLLLPAGVRAPSDTRQPLRDRRVIFATFDAGTEVIRRGLNDLGARADHAATVPTAIAIARRAGCPAAVPQSAVAVLRPKERLATLPWKHRVALDLVVPRTADTHPERLRAKLRSGLGLS